MKSCFYALNRLRGIQALLEGDLGELPEGAGSLEVTELQLAWAVQAGHECGALAAEVAVAVVEEDQAGALAHWARASPPFTLNGTTSGFIPW